MYRGWILVALCFVLAGCASMGGGRGSLWAYIENTRQTQPVLTDYEKGKRNLQLGQIGLAIASFQAELNQKPESIPALNGLAVAYEKMGRSDIAQYYFDQALVLDQDSAVTLNNMAYLKLKQGDTELALSYFARAIEVSLTDMGITLSAAITEAISNNIDVARRMTAEAVAAIMAQGQPESPNVVNNIERVGSREWQLYTSTARVSESGSNIFSSPDQPSVRVEGAELSRLPVWADGEGGKRASASQGKAWTASVPATTFLRVANGTGRAGMAGRFESYFSSHGLRIDKVVNAASYDYEQSVIFYNLDQKIAAQDLAAALPFPIKLREATKFTGQIDIILGFDLLEFDEVLLRGSV